MSTVRQRAALAIVAVRITRTHFIKRFFLLASSSLRSLDYGGLDYRRRMNDISIPAKREIQTKSAEEPQSWASSVYRQLLAEMLAAYWHNWLKARTETYSPSVA